MHYDLIIIGAGPAGLACAIEAKRNSLNYLVIEKGVLVNSIFNFPSNMTFFSTSKKLEVGDVPFISHTDKPTRREALEYYRRLAESHALNIQYANKVVGVEKSDIFKLKSGKGDYTADYVIAATGYFDNARLLGVAGENLDKVRHYYDEAHRYIGQKLVVVGGANSACDVALETLQKGAEVTMVIRSHQLYQKVKYWILPNIENRIKEGSINAYFNSTLEEIKEKTVRINTPDGVIEIENDYVLAMTGYLPDYEFLENLGIQFSNTPEKIPVFNKETLESNVPNLYLAGVINSGMQTSKLFIENTREDGKRILKSITNNLDKELKSP